MRNTAAVAITLLAGSCSVAVAEVSTIRIASGLSSPLFVTSPPDDASRLFIVERGGTIKILDRTTGTVSATPFLSLPSTVVETAGGEQGLLGLAFHPDYATNGKFYINYTRDGDGTTVVAEYQRLNDNQADPTSARQIISYAQP